MKRKGQSYSTSFKKTIKLKESSESEELSLSESEELYLSESEELSLSESEESSLSEEEELYLSEEGENKTICVGKDNDSELSPYEEYLELLESVYYGDYIETEITKGTLIKKHKERGLSDNESKEEIKKINKILKDLKNNYIKSLPTLEEIVNLNITDEYKFQLITEFHNVFNSESIVMSSEYIQNIKELKKKIAYILDHNPDDIVNKLEKDIGIIESDISIIKKRIVESKMSYSNKIIAYKRLKLLETINITDNNSSDYSKYKMWLDTLLEIPFGEYKNLENSDLKKVREILDKNLSFLENPKDQILNIIIQKKINPEYKVNAIGICSDKGMGKTSLVKSISEALDIPYKTINLGGESDASILSGHHFTYTGSMQGRIVDILRETKCMNNIIFFDEVDKISETKNGREIIGSLIHLTDTTTNYKYNDDKYFSGIEFDLSKVLFIFAYNDESKIDKILADRILKINVQPYTFKEKREIVRKHLLVDVQKNSKCNDSIDEESIIYLVNTSDGLREIKQKLEIIYQRLFTLKNTKKEDNIIKLKYKILYNTINENFTLNLKDIKVLLEDSIMKDSTTTNTPFGMYI
jgi:ATP-dependent Lon protease